MVNVSPLLEVADILYDYVTRILPETLVMLTEPIAENYEIPDAVREIMPDWFEIALDNLLQATPLHFLFYSVVAVFLVRPVVKFLTDILPFV